MALPLSKALILWELQFPVVQLGTWMACAPPWSWISLLALHRSSCIRSRSEYLHRASAIIWPWNSHICICRYICICIFGCASLHMFKTETYLLPRHHGFFRLVLVHLFNDSSKVILSGVAQILCWLVYGYNRNFLVLNIGKGGYANCHFQLSFQSCLHFQAA